MLNRSDAINFINYSRSLSSPFPPFPISPSIKPQFKDCVLFFVGIFVGLSLKPFFPDLEYYYRYIKDEYFYGSSYSKWFEQELQMSKQNKLNPEELVELETTLETDNSPIESEINCESPSLDITGPNQILVKEIATVLPSWIDRNKHMNNARYIYELNFSRRRALNKMGIWPYLHENDLNLIIKSQYIRYRKELVLGQEFEIHTRILSWSDTDNIIHIETKFVIPDLNNFVAAIHYTKYFLMKKKSKNSGNILDYFNIFNNTTNQNSPSNNSKAPTPTPTEIFRILKLIPEESYAIKSPTNLCEYDNLILDYLEKADQVSSKKLNPNKKK